MMRRAIIAVGLVVGMPVVGMADIRPLLTNSAVFSDSNALGNLTVTVKYEVFAPNTYPEAWGTTIYPLLGSAPDLATHYIYAYQLHNDAGSTAAVSAFNLGVGEAPVTALGYDAIAGETTPIDLLSGVVAGSAFFSLMFDPLPAGGSSAVLLLASIQGPTIGAVNINNGTFVASGTLPTPAPIPAPGALLLVTLGLVPLGWLRRHLA